MILKRRVSLNGTQLDSLDSRILITGIDECAGKETISAVSLGAASGQRITNRRRDTLDVTVKFTMNIKSSDMSARAQLLEAVNIWAAPGGLLTVGHRPGRRLRVVLAQAPGGGDQFNWTNEYTLTFRAYNIPYWEDTTATTSTGASITVPGSAETVCDVEVVNGSGATIDSLTVAVGSSSMSFSSLGLADAERLVIGHTDDGILYIRKYTGSSYFVRVMNKRTGADDLTVMPGTRSITVSGTGVTWTVSVRGRYV